MLDQVKAAERDHQTCHARGPNMNDGTAATNVHYEAELCRPYLSGFDKA